MSLVVITGREIVAVFDKCNGTEQRTKDEIGLRRFLAGIKAFILLFAFVVIILKIRGVEQIALHAQFYAVPLLIPTILLIDVVMKMEEEP